MDMTTKPEDYRTAKRKFENQVENIFYITSVDVSMSNGGAYMGVYSPEGCTAGHPGIISM